MSLPVNPVAPSVPVPAAPATCWLDTRLARSLVPNLFLATSFSGLVLFHFVMVVRLARISIAATVCWHIFFFVFLCVVVCGNLDHVFRLVPSYPNDDRACIGWGAVFFVVLFSTPFVCGFATSAVRDELSHDPRRDHVDPLVASDPWIQQQLSSTPRPVLVFVPSLVNTTEHGEAFSFSSGFHQALRLDPNLTSVVLITPFYESKGEVWLTLIPTEWTVVANSAVADLRARFPNTTLQKDAVALTGMTTGVDYYEAKDFYQGCQLAIILLVCIPTGLALVVTTYILY